MRTSDEKYREIITPRPKRKRKVRDLPEDLRMALQERFDRQCAIHTDPFIAAERIGAEIRSEGDVPVLYW